jgi:hypothetical protein
MVNFDSYGDERVPFGDHQFRIYLKPNHFAQKAQQEWELFLRKFTTNKTSTKT